MKTPVMIPAYNESSRIGRTLECLPADLVEPIVVVNGSSDDTAEIARGFGVKVIETERQGKMPAIQLGLREMGARALEPFILLDADTKPVAPRLWSSVLLRALQPDIAEPKAISAPVYFTKNPDDPKSSHASAFVRSAYRQIHGAAARVIPGAAPAYYGPNQAYKLQNSETLESVLALDHIWPEEDVAMTNVIIEHGGSFTQSIDNRAIVTSPESAAFAPFLDYVFHPSEVHAAVAEAYRRNAPPDSRPIEAV